LTLKAQNSYPPLKLGEHMLSLQWISWEKMGKIKIANADNEGWHIAQGLQNSDENQDYLKVDGKIKQISPSELLFDGVIESRVSFVNSGEPCLRTGTFHFKATGKRKYWRLQEMENCEGNMVTDYVDIYF
jgi:hypothetical protein